LWLAASSPIGQGPSSENAASGTSAGSRRSFCAVRPRSSASGRNSFRTNRIPVIGAYRGLACSRECPVGRGSDLIRVFADRLAQSRSEWRPAHTIHDEALTLGAHQETALSRAGSRCAHSEIAEFPPWQADVMLQHGGIDTGSDGIALRRWRAGASARSEEPAEVTMGRGCRPATHGNVQRLGVDGEAPPEFVRDYADVAHKERSRADRPPH